MKWLKNMVKQRELMIFSIVAFTGAVTAMILRMGVPIPLALIVGLTVGAAIGFFNGFIIAKIGINPFVTTLSSLSLFRGLTLIVTRGQNITGLPKAYKAIGQAKIVGIQTPIIIAAVLIILGAFLGNLMLKQLTTDF